MTTEEEQVYLADPIPTASAAHARDNGAEEVTCMRCKKVATYQAPRAMLPKGMRCFARCWNCGEATLMGPVVVGAIRIEFKL